MSGAVGRRGRLWFRALTGRDAPMEQDPSSVLTADAELGDELARFICVVPNPVARFPCARQGEIGLEEACTLAARVREVLELAIQGKKRPIVAIVDVKSQAYGRREEIAGLFQIAAAAADAYATARMSGHPVIALITGQALSGAFLTHGYQANRILAFDDSAVVVHAMHREAAARITLKSVTDIEDLSREIVPMSYDIHDYAKLGLLHKLLGVDNPDVPSCSTTVQVKTELINAIADVRARSGDVWNRAESGASADVPKARILVRARMKEQWAAD